MIRKKKKIEFVCCAIINNSLVSKSMEAKSSDEASILFRKEYNIIPEFIHGPFFRKRGEQADSSRKIEFLGISKKAIYKGWIVTANLLSYPKDSAFLFFDKRQDEKKLPKPSNNLIVKITDIEEFK